MDERLGENEFVGTRAFFAPRSPIAYVCLTAMTFRSEKVQKVIVWVVSKKNRQQQQQKKNTVGDEDNNESYETEVNRSVELPLPCTT